MDTRRIFALLLACVLSVGTGWYVMRTIEAERRAAIASVKPSPDFKEVLVAATDIPVGTFVPAEALRWQAWPDVDIPPAFLVKGEDDATQLAGAVARRSLVAGEPVGAEQFVKPGERGFLAAVLAPGQRAVSVPVDDASGNAGLIFPGDRVDLVLSQIIAGESASDPQRRVSETILADVRVLAMGRRMQPQAQEEADGPGNQIRTVTLEVSPEGAEKVALVTDLGRLSLSLRALAQSDPTPTVTASPEERRLTWDRDVTRALGAESTTAPVTILRGGKTEPVSVSDVEAKAGMTDATASGERINLGTKAFR